MHGRSLNKVLPKLTIHGVVTTPVKTCLFLVLRITCLAENVSKMKHHIAKASRECSQNTYQTMDVRA